MKHSIDQLLQDAVVAHKSGQFQEAERLYTTILNSQPNSPDANHNMGVLALSNDKIEQALSYFRTALESNPNVAQFWLSYLDALIKKDRIEDAKNLYLQAKQRGAKGDGFDKIGQRLEGLGVLPQVERPAQDSNKRDSVSFPDNLKLDEALKLARKKLIEGSTDEAKSIFNDILKKHPQNKKAKEGIKALMDLTVEKSVIAQDPPREQLQPLIQLYSQNRLQEALVLAESLLRQYSNSVTLNSICGTANARLNRFDLAIDYFRKALEIKPDNAETLSNLGIVLKENGDIEAAINSYNKAIKIKPGVAETYSNLGLALQERGDLEAAIVNYKKALSIKPGIAEIHYNLGNALMESGDLQAAISNYKKTLLIKPDYAEAFSNMGDALRERGDLDAAIGCYEKALSINPGIAETYSNLGIALQENGDVVGALEKHKKAIEINPALSEAYVNMGNALKDQGDLGNAILSFESALSIKPGFAEAHRNLSLIKEYSHGDPQIDQMQNLYNDTNITNTARCHLAFSLAKAYEDLGEFEQAFFYLSDGNAQRKKMLAYDISQDISLFNKLKHFSNQLIDVQFESSAELSNPIPIFILGMPRSGTTLVEQIISSHSKVTGAGELDFLSRYGSSLVLGQAEPAASEFQGFRTQYLSALLKRSDSRNYVTDKMPQNFRYIPLICASIPQAKIIHVQRDPAATCWSNFRHYFSTTGLGYSYDLRDVVTYYGLYRDLMNHWQKAYGNRIYNLDYEKLTTDQDHETRMLLEYLALEWQDAVAAPERNLRAVKTASYQQVRSKVYQGSSQQWRKYEPFLNGAFDELQNHRVSQEN